MLSIAALLGLIAATTPSKKERLSALPPEEREWVTEFVAPIILPEEERLFLELTEPHQREIFQEEFWGRRERPGLIAPLGPGYRSRYAELRRLADERYDGWKQDAGRIVLRWGEPDSIQRPACSEILREVEIWSYRNPATGKGNRVYLFFRLNPLDPRKLWTFGMRDSDLFTPASCWQTYRALAFECTDSFSKLVDPCALAKHCAEACGVFHAWEEVRLRQGSVAGASIELADLMQPQQVSTEGLDQLRSRFPSVSDPTAKSIPVEGPSGPPQTAVAPTPSARRHLTGDEMRELFARLEPKYREWLELAGPLMTYDDWSSFLQLSNPQKDKFMRGFLKKQSGRS